MAASEETRADLVSGGRAVIEHPAMQQLEHSTDHLHVSVNLMK